MAYMRSSVAFALFWVNFIVASLNIFFSIKLESVAYSKYKYEEEKSRIPPPYNPYNPDYPYRYILTKNETLLEKNQIIFLRKKIKLKKNLEIYLIFMVNIK